MKYSKTLLTFAAFGFLGEGLLRADFITDWNNAQLDYISANSVDEFNASRGLAMTSISVYDAVNGVTREDPAFYVSGSASAGASMDAAIAAASYTMMTSLYGSNSAFTTLYNNEIASISASSTSISNGVSWGNYVANSVVADRSSDGASSANSTYSGPSGTGYWSPAPGASSSNPVLPGWGSVTPFALNTGSQFRPNGPVAPDSGQFITDYNQVMSLGSAISTARTSDQTNIANLWNTQAATAATAGVWNKVVQSAASGAGYSLNQEAKLFAAVNISIADAAITASDAKYSYDSWRPITAIQGGAAGFGLTTDPSWTPLNTTPNSPEYVSLQGAVSSAAATALAKMLFNGDAYTFTVSDGTITRSYSSFSDAAAEAGMSGVYGGIAFLSSVTDGQTLGDTVATVVTNDFTALPAPVPEPSGALCIMAAGLFFILKNRNGLRSK